MGATALREWPLLPGTIRSTMLLISAINRTYNPTYFLPQQIRCITTTQAGDVEEQIIHSPFTAMVRIVVLLQNSTTLDRPFRFDTNVKKIIPHVSG